MPLIARCPRGCGQREGGSGSGMGRGCGAVQSVPAPSSAPGLRPRDARFACPRQRLQGEVAACIRIN